MRESRPFLAFVLAKLLNIRFFDPIPPGGLMRLILGDTGVRNMESSRFDDVSDAGTLVIRRHAPGTALQLSFGR